MSMTLEQSTRYTAIHLLALAASAEQRLTLDEIADALGIDNYRNAPVKLARRYLAESVGAGTWREARAEAEARIRHEAQQAESRRRGEAMRTRWQAAKRSQRRIGGRS